MTGSADEPVRVGGHSTGGQGVRVRPHALLRAPAAIRDAVYQRLENTRFRTGVTMLGGCLVVAVALAAGLVLLGRSAPAAHAPQAGGPAAVTPDTPLASSSQPHSGRPHTAASGGRPQPLVPAAANDPQASPGHPVRASAPAASGEPAYAPGCSPLRGGYPPGHGWPGCPAGHAPGRWHHYPGKHRRP